MRYIIATCRSARFSYLQLIFISIVGIVAAGIGTQNCMAQVGVGLLPQIKPVTLKTIDDQSFQFVVGGNKAVVVVFITTDCPIANSYLPILNDVKLECDKLGMKMLLIHSGPRDTEEMKQHSTEYNIRIPVAIDLDKSVAGQMGVTVTPEAVIVGPDGQLLYRGRIDDRIAGYGKRRIAPNREDLREAIKEVADGRVVSVPITKAIGCIISE